MYDELVKDLRENHDKYFARDMQAADAIVKLQKRVPKRPHGRLIDADALDADLERQDMHTGEWNAVGFSIEEIENAPTVIEAEDGET